MAPRANKKKQTGKTKDSQEALRSTTAKAPRAQKAVKASKVQKSAPAKRATAASKTALAEKAENVVATKRTSTTNPSNAVTSVNVGPKRPKSKKETAPTEEEDTEPAPVALKTGRATAKAKKQQPKAKKATQSPCDEITAAIQEEVKNKKLAEANAAAKAITAKKRKLARDPEDDQTDDRPRGQKRRKVAAQVEGEDYQGDEGDLRMFKKMKEKLKTSKSTIVNKISTGKRKLKSISKSPGSWLKKKKYIPAPDPGEWLTGGNRNDGNGRDPPPCAAGNPENIDEDEEIDGLPVAPAHRLPRPGEWPREGAFKKSIAMQRPPPCGAAPPSEEVDGYNPKAAAENKKQEIIDKRVSELEGMLKNKSLSKTYADNITAVTNHYKRHKAIVPLDKGAKFSCWVNGARVTEEEAQKHGEEYYIEPAYEMLRDGFNARAVFYRPDYRGGEEDIDPEEGVFGQPMTISEDRKSIGHWKLKMACWYNEQDARAKFSAAEYLANYDPNDPAHAFESVALFDAIIDTGASVPVLSPARVRECENNREFTGGTSLMDLKLADGSVLVCLMRFFDYCFLHYGTVERITPVRRNAFIFPFDYETNERSTPPLDMVDLAGVSILSHDNWLLSKGNPKADGSGYAAPRDLPKLWSARKFENFEPCLNDPNTVAGGSQPVVII